MGTVVLGWDLDRGTRWVPRYEVAVTRVALTGPVTAPWHLGRGPVPAPDSRVHLMLQGRIRGLVGRGVVRSAPFRAGPTDRPGTVGTHVLVEWDRLLPIDERIPCDRLARLVPAVIWADAYRDVFEVPDEVGEELDLLWDAPPRCAAPTKLGGDPPRGRGSHLGRSPWPGADRPPVTSRPVSRHPVRRASAIVLRGGVLPVARQWVRCAA